MNSLHLIYVPQPPLHSETLPDEFLFLLVSSVFFPLAFQHVEKTTFLQSFYFICAPIWIFVLFCFVSVGLPVIEFQLHAIVLVVKKWNNFVFIFREPTF